MVSTVSEVMYAYRGVGSTHLSKVYENRPDRVGRETSDTRK